MAKALTSGVPDRVTLATTVTRLTRTAFDTWRTLTVTELVSGSTTVIYVDVVGTADGAALPASSRIALSVLQLPATVDISGYGAVGLAGDVAGVVGAVIR